MIYKCMQKFKNDLYIFFLTISTCIINIYSKLIPFQDRTNFSLYLSYGNLFNYSLFHYIYLEAI